MLKYNINKLNCKLMGVGGLKCKGKNTSQKKYETNLCLEWEVLYFGFWRGKAYSLEKSQILG